MSELDAAWNAVHDALPAGWQVMRPSYHVETRQWHVFAADHRDGRKQPDYIQAVGQDDAHCLRGLAEILRVWRVGVPVRSEVEVERPERWRPSLI